MSGLSSLTDYAQAAHAGDFNDAPGWRHIARKETAQKDQARGRVLRSIFSVSRREKPLRILTMPSVRWSLERSLIANREHGKGLRRPRCTHITAIESHPAIFRAAVLTMPGLEDGLAVLAPTPYAAHSVRTPTISRFHHTSFEDLAFAFEDGGNSYWHDAAWIDLCGQVSFRRLDALEALWPYVARLLIVTSLRGRWEQGLNDRVADRGVTRVIGERLRGAVVIDDHEYQSGVPMHQVAFTKGTS